jgi:preprotein translocase subunit SecE
MVKKTEPLKTEPAIVEPKASFNPVQLIQDSKVELTKVIWPNRQQLISESLAVIAMVSVSAISIYLVNNFFNWLANEVVFKVPSV